MSYIFGGDTPNENTDRIEGSNIGAFFSSFPLSIAFWAKPASTSMIDRDEYMLCLSTAPTGNENAYVIIRDYTPKKAIFYQTSTAGTQSNSNQSTGLIDTVVWHLFVLVTDADGSDATLHFHNGTTWDSTAVVTGSANIPTLANCDSIKIGQRNNSSNNTGFIGKMAEVSTWSGYALTSDDRTALLTTKANALGTTQTAAQTAYWPLYNDLDSDVGSWATLTATGATVDTSDHPTLSAGSSVAAAIAGRHYSRMRA